MYIHHTSLRNRTNDIRINNDQQHKPLTHVYVGAILATYCPHELNSHLPPLSFSKLSAMPTNNKIRDQTAEEVQDANLRAGMTQGYEAVVKAKAAARAPSPPGRRDALAMSPPLKAPPPTAKRSPPVPHAAAKPQGKPPPPRPDTLAPSPTGAQAAGARGPNFGGSYIPESTAGSVFTSYRVPVGLMGRSIRMLAAEATHRDLKTFPRAAFERLPPDDPPALRVIGGVKGPGWFRFLQTEDRWHGPPFTRSTQR